MSIHSTLASLKIFCNANSGNENEWFHNGVHYRWNLGRDVLSGNDINGVVRKKSETGDWVLAGSLKIQSDGKILRFTGLGKKVQKTFLDRTDTTKVLELA